MILKLSDLKGRTDLVGREALIKEKRSFGVIREIKDNTLLFDTIAENYLWELKFSEPLTIELLDEEPYDVIPPTDLMLEDKIGIEKMSSEEFNAKYKKDTLEPTRTLGYKDIAPAVNKVTLTKGRVIVEDMTTGFTVNRFTPVDERTEVTLDNLTMDDFVSVLMGPNKITVREFLRNHASSFVILQKEQPIKMTLSQIEEKLGFKVEIVE